MKLIILLLSCNQKYFKKQTEETKRQFQKQIDHFNLNDSVKIYSYTSGTNEGIINDTIYCDELDDENHTYEKTIRCFEILDENNIEYDYIFRTNTSTFVNIKLLYEFINYIHNNNFFNDKYFSSVLCSTNSSFAPKQYDIVGQGKGMLFNKYLLHLLLSNKYLYNNEVIKEKYTFIREFIDENDKHITCDDTTISTIYNLIHIYNNENYVDYMYTFLHHNSYSELKNSKMNTWNNVKNYISITVKNSSQGNIDYNDYMKELSDIICSNGYDDNELYDIVLKNIYVNNYAPVFKGFNENPMFEYIKRNINFDKIMKYKIALITLCYNETPIMPFVLDYWRKFAAHAYVFDNGSTDGSKETLEKLDWVTVIDYSHLTGNKFDDKTNIYIKNEFWKTIRDFYDFVVICDFDECIYCEHWDEILNTLRYYQIRSVIPGNYYDMITEEFPEYNPQLLFHEFNKTYIEKTPEEIERFGRKPLIFDCHFLEEINIEMGGHNANPIEIRGFYGRPKLFASEKVQLYDFSLYHLCCLGYDYVKNRRLAGGERMSQENKDNHLGMHYLKNEEEIKKEFEENLSKRKQF